MKKVIFTILLSVLFIAAGSLRTFSQDKSKDNSKNNKEKSTDSKISAEQKQKPSVTASGDAVSSGLTFTQTTGGTVLGTTANDDESYNALPIGFTFYYHGTAFTQFSVNNNGFIGLGASVSSSYSPLSVYANIIAAMAMDLQGQAATTGENGSVLWYQTVGFAPNRVLVVTWQNYRKYFTTIGNDVFNFQIMLHETTNKVEIVYGNCRTATGSYTCQVGLTGASTADFADRTTTTNWAATTTGAANTATCTITTAIVPAAGQTFTWTGAGTVATYSYGGSTGGTALAGTDDESFNALPIGFTFNYNSGTYTTFGVNSNGYIVLGTAGTSYTPLSSYANCICALGRDIQYIAAPSIWYQTIGAAPNRELLITWVKWRKYGNSGDTINFQIKLYETTGKIGMLYLGAVSNVTGWAPQVGLTGSATSDFNDRTNTTSWTTTTAGATNAVTMVLSSTVYPNAGQTFMWDIPTGPPDPASLTATPFSSSQINLNWLAGGNPAGTNYMLAWNSTNVFGVPVNGTVYTVGNTIPGGGTVLYYNTALAYNHTSLTAATTYYYKLWAVNPSTQYSPGVTANATTPCNAVSALPYGYGFGTTGILDACWTAQIVSGTYNWTLVTTMSYPTQNPYVGPYMAEFPSFSASLGYSARLKSPTFNFSSFSNPRLLFYMSRDIGYPSPSDSVYIEVSTDGGATYTALNPGYQRYLSTASTPIWEQETVNLDAYGGNSNVTIGIRAMSMYGDNMAIDSVVVKNASPVSYSSSTATQTVTTGVPATATNAQIIGVQIVTAGELGSTTATSLTFNTNGSTNPATDIAKARVWFTGTSPVFATTTQFGSDVNTPSGSFVVNGTATLPAGTNYFWLVYDITASPTSGDVVDAECNQLTVGGSNYVPTVQAPAGNRTISASLSGIKNIQPSGGDYPSLTNTGGIFDAINNGGLSGNLTIKINSDLTGETGAVQLNQWIEVNGSNYTVNIVPGDATLKTISGNVAQALIRLNGSSRVIFDGNGGFADGPRRIPNINENSRIKGSLNLGNDNSVNYAGDAPGGPKYLLFRNTNGSNPTFLIQNGASNVTITNCYIESNNNGALGSTATIVIGGTSGTTGNNNVTISYNDIRDNSDATGTPVSAILASGNVTYPNNVLWITQNNIYNWHSSTQTSVAAYLLDGCPSMIFTGNSIYQTVSRTPGNTLAQFGVIMSTSSANNVITGNYFGGTLPHCGGTAMTYFDGAGLFGFRIFNTGTASASFCQNNYVDNIDYTSTYAGLGFFFRGIDVNGNPSANVTVSNNIIGSTIVNDRIILRYNAPAGTSSPSPCAIGFGYNSGVALSGSVTNNSVGGITLTGTGTTTGTAFTLSGIAIGSVVTTAISCTGNSIGGGLTNNIQNSLTSTVPVLVYGIYSAAATANPGLTLTGNLVQNITNGSTASGTNPLTAAIYHGGTAGFTCTGNTVFNIRSAGGYSGAIYSPQIVGIFDASSSTLQNISQNTIDGLYETSVAVVSPHVHGVTITSGSSTGTLSKNKISNLSNTSTSAGAIIGVSAYWGIWTASNNMISITNGEASDAPGKKTSGNNLSKVVPIVTPTTVISDLKNSSRFDNSGNKRPVKTLLSASNDGALNTIESPLNTKPKKGEPDFVNTLTIYGIFDDASGWSEYYNSIYIGGSASSGALNSYGFYKASVNPTLKNNLIVNARTGGTGKHYCIYSSSAFVSNYNVFIGSNANTIGSFSGTDQTIAQWRTSMSNDNQTWSTTTSDVVPTSLFTNIATGNLHINPNYSGSWIVYGKGIAVAGQGTDYDGTVRSVTIAGGTTAIGSHQVSVNSSGNPPVAATETGGPPVSGVTTTYTLWNRVIASVAWGTSGTSYPTTLAVRYYSGVNPSSVLGGNYSNSYTTITPTGTFSGTTCNVTYYFGDNETYTISTPATNTILAKFDPSSWEVFQPGSGVYQTQLVYNTSTEVFTTLVNGIYNFSNFALTDVTAPLPVQIASFEAIASNRNIALRWTTSREQNNKGFDIERSTLANVKTNEYSAWTKIGFADGHGNTNEQQTYTYSDSKMTTGKYKYRLKQIDYNGNSEYYVLHNPEVVEIGKPITSGVTQNYPNPSNPKSKIDYQIPFDGKISIKIYDVVGREVVTLVNEVKESGYYTAEFDGTNLASGIYFYRIIAEGNGQKFTDTKKMVLVK